MKILHFKNHFKMSESNVDLSPTPEVEKYLPIKTNNAIVPVTIKQIIEARPSEDQLNSKIIDFVERKEVSIVGIVLSYTQNSYSTMYEVDDGTGSYQVQVIHPESSMNEDNSPPVIELFKSGQYVSVTGRLSSTSQENQTEPIPVISAYSIRFINDCNQIPYHFLHSLYAHLVTLKNNEGKFETDPGQIKITDYIVYDDQKPKKKSNGYDNDNDSGNEKIDSSPINLNDIQPYRLTAQKKLEIVKKSVLRLLSNTTADNGLDVQKIFGHFSSMYSIDDIQSAIDSLSYNGEIVSTGLDERYFIV